LRIEKVGRNYQTPGAAGPEDNVVRAIHRQYLAHDEGVTGDETPMTWERQHHLTKKNLEKKEEPPQKPCAAIKGKRPPAREEKRYKKTREGEKKNVRVELEKGGHDFRGKKKWAVFVI